MSREAMQMALEALESDPISHVGLVSRKQAITALRQALEQAMIDKAVRDEREACARVCQELKPFGPHLYIQKATAEDCAAAIRSRGEK